MISEKLVRNLAFRGFKVTCFEKSEDAAAYIASSVEGQTVGIGGSMTVKELGLYEKLSVNNKVYWHWIVPGDEIYMNAACAEIYISSANAISEDGEIINIDAKGNRVSAVLYGPGRKKLYIVAGVNKIEKDFDAALSRARNTAAVKNIGRFPQGQPCQIDGRCHDCRGEKRFCNGLAVLYGPMLGVECEVVLIDENLGF